MNGDYLRTLRSQFRRCEGAAHHLGLDEYQDYGVQTDQTHLPSRQAINFLLLGLYGEVGSLLSELKKKQRDQVAYQSYQTSAQEEFGDVLWYFANLASKVGLKLSELVDLSKPMASSRGRIIRASTIPEPISTFAQLQPQARLVTGPADPRRVEKTLLNLAQEVGSLISAATKGRRPVASRLKEPLTAIFGALVWAARDSEINLEAAALENLQKTLGRWPVHRDLGRLYDDDEEEDERLPRHMEVRFKEKWVGDRAHVILQWQGVNIGDRLTDNRAYADDYRFHDVFHLSYAAILGWSPVLRGLLRVKRKSNPQLDEQQDGARAMITEEGIANWIFAHGERHDHFKGVRSLDFALLKTIRHMVKGYEVESRPLWMWERAVLEGFKVFRDLKRNRGGIVIADLNRRTLDYGGS